MTLPMLDRVHDQHAATTPYTGRHRAPGRRWITRHTPRHTSQEPTS